MARMPNPRRGRVVVDPVSGALNRQEILRFDSNRRDDAVAYG